jgi:branched-chain amino acid transport system permease protein
VSARRPRLHMPQIIEPTAQAWDRLPSWGKWAGRGLALLLAIIAPAPFIGQIMAPDSDWASVLFYPIAIYVLLALGLNVVVGQAGLLDLGYVAFFAIGAYTMALLGTRLGWSFWVILPCAIGASAASGLILGTPTLRLRGDYLAIVTLGFGEIVRITAVNTEELGGPRGIAGIPHPPSVEGFDALKFGVIDPKPYYYLTLALIVLVIIMIRRLEASRIGRGWVAIREDEDAAEAMGVPTFRYKLWAFAIGASIGGATGTVFASKVIAIVPDNFPFILSVLILCAVVLGGSGNLPGVILGAFMIAWLPERFRGFAEYRVLIFVAALVAIMIFRPEGLLPSRQRRAEMESGGGGMGSLGAEVTETGESKVDA